MSKNHEVYSSQNYPGAHDYGRFPTITPNSGDVTHHPFKVEIEHFIDCIERNIESPASILDSDKPMAINFAIDASATKGGQPVKVQICDCENGPL